MIAFIRSFFKPDIKKLESQGHAHKLAYLAIAKNNPKIAREAELALIRMGAVSFPAIHYYIEFTEGDRVWKRTDPALQTHALRALKIFAQLIGTSAMKAGMNEAVRMLERVLTGHQHQTLRQHQKTNCSNSRYWTVKTNAAKTLANIHTLQSTKALFHGLNTFSAENSSPMKKKLVIIIVSQLMKNKTLTLTAIWDATDWSFSNNKWVNEKIADIFSEIDIKLLIDFFVCKLPIHYNAKKLFTHLITTKSTKISFTQKDLQGIIKIDPNKEILNNIARRYHATKDGDRKAIIDVLLEYLEHHTCQLEYNKITKTWSGDAYSTQIDVTTIKDFTTHLKNLMQKNELPSLLKYVQIPYLSQYILQIIGSNINSNITDLEPELLKSLLRLRDITFIYLNQRSDTTYSDVSDTSKVYLYYEVVEKKLEVSEILKYSY